MDKETFGKLIRENKRLARGLSRIETVFNSIRSAIIVTDESGDMQFANNFAKDILGIGDSSMSIFKLLNGIDKAILNLEEDDVSIKEFEISYPQYRLLSAEIIPFNFDNNDKTYAIILNDITQERKSTQERIESEKIASVLNLASGVAHELGNPLNSINIHLQLVKRKLSKLANQIPTDFVDSISDSIDICTSEVSRLDGIIENFLKALRPIRPNLLECDPIKPLAETLKILNQELLDMDISIDVDSEIALPTVFADENLLKQLYFNILKNAMESMTKSGSIRIHASSDDDVVSISFADSGCGISQENISHLFEPYFTTKSDGHGLGMMIIKAIVRAHGGKIDIDSKENSGTTVTISIPRKEPRIKQLSGDF